MRKFVKVMCITPQCKWLFIINTNYVRMGGVVFNHITHKYMRITGMGWEGNNFVVHVRAI